MECAATTAFSLAQNSNDHVNNKHTQINTRSRAKLGLRTAETSTKAANKPSFRNQSKRLKVTQCKILCWFWLECRGCCQNAGRRQWLVVLLLPSRRFPAGLVCIPLCMGALLPVPVRKSSHLQATQVLELYRYATSMPGPKYKLTLTLRLTYPSKGLQMV